MEIKTLDYSPIKQSIESDMGEKTTRKMMVYELIKGTELNKLLKTQRFKDDFYKLYSNSDSTKKKQSQGWQDFLKELQNNNKQREK